MRRVGEVRERRVGVVWVRRVGEVKCGYGE
jgi:hypothetical protein